MQFWSYGPFNVGLSNENELWRREFWQEVSEYNDDAGGMLRNAIGCYVFIMSRAGKLRPWYVGKTNAVAGFQGEIFTEHKLKHYRGVISEAPQGWKPQMLLFPLITGGGMLSKAYKTDKPLIEWMERTLIGMALAKNPLLYNSKDTTLLRNCIVDGVFGDFKAHQRYDGAIAARKALTDHNDWDV
ncbi:MULTISPECIES: hypothetical protein [Rhizobium]|uniref:hypothetical protein n=1 Tax=Rhizobium TaxID=379 RepID=UPI001C923714|nr:MULTISPECIES: hypothetical protein [Rhizobium]MBY3172047.1 hypothetical protein [Rhizobium laguerreae]MBY3227561.1 hypothetical protein [Rhizobium laguerreae]MBY3515898.1 hypothetical protein [Rhizobium laguerreae]UWM76420.1 hypothetical protein N1937_04010 [Rhizobium leguminosarum bv. viciae]